MKVGIGRADLQRFIPDHRLRSQRRAPVEFDEGRVSLGIDKAEGMDAEAFHHAVAARDGAVRHDPHDHVKALGRQRNEVPESVMRGLGLRKFAIRLGFGRVNEIGELDRVLDEEDRDVVADEIEVAFLRCRT